MSLSNYLLESIDSIRKSIPFTNEKDVPALLHEVDILEKHKAKYLAKVKAGMPEPIKLGEIRVVENSNDYLQGFRDGVIRVTNG